ncbi:hypothetical protein B0T13DRAFT_534005 [Neurospora crassa]|nr:hypothetical protein B0T13DRAFT_534005 [Neurospora crassa]
MSIDLGSSGIRACLRPPNRDAEVVWIENNSNESNPYTFIAQGCGFGTVNDEDIYDGYELQTGREEVAIKYGLNILTDAPAELTDEYPLMDDLLAEDARDSQNFRRRLRIGIIGMLRFMRERAEETMNGMGNTEGWVINKLTVSIPSQWNLEFEAVYRDLLRRAFDWSLALAREQIKFYFEIEGLAGSLLVDHRGQLVRNGRHGDQLCLMLDFGGHSMNGCLYWVTSESGKVANFFAAGSPFGTGGGGEHFIDRLVNTCVRKVAEESNDTLNVTAAGKAQAKALFKRYRAHMGPGGRTRAVNLVVNTGPETFVNCHLSEEDILQAWEDAFGRTIQMAKTNIEALVERDEVRHFNTTALVVLAGGSLKNNPLAQRIMKVVKEASLDDAQLVFHKGGDSQSVRNAVGMGHDEVHQVSIDDFFNRGVGIGVQIQPGGQGEWEDVAYCMLYYDTQRKTDVHPACAVQLFPQDRVRLICDPAFGKNRTLNNNSPSEDEDLDMDDFDNSDEPNVEMTWKRTYDFLDALPQPSHKSRCEWSLRRERDGEKVVLNLSITMTPIMRSKAASQRLTKKWNFVLPLYFDPGTRCVMPGRKSTTVEEAIPALFLDRDGDAHMSG